MTEQTYTEEDLEQHFEERSEETPEVEAEVEAPQAEPEPEPEGEPEEPAAETSDDERAQADRLYRYLQSRPDVAQALVGVEQGQYAVVPREQLESQRQPEPEQVQEVDFWSDPEKAFRDLNQKLLDQERFIQEKTVSDNHAAIQTGMAVFARNHPELKPEDVQQVGAVLRDKALLPSYWQRQPNYLGVQEAMEDAYRMAFFDRGKTAAAKDIAKASKDKRRAAAVGGSRASAPRETPTPQDPAARRAAMVREFEEAMNANT